MNEVLVILLIIASIVSFIPVVNMIKNKRDQNYRCLKYLMFSTFAWSVLILLERMSTTNIVVYYAHMIGYPLKFLVASFMFCTIFDYVDQRLPKGVFGLLAGLFIAEFLIAMSNSTSGYFLSLSLSELNSFNDLYTASNGPLFIYHLVMTYLVLVISVAFLFYYLIKKKDVRRYRAVTRTMVVSICIVLGFNLLQLFIIETNVDLTYISLVIVTYGLYLVIYSKDMVFNLLTSGRGKILTNMRELYILTDSERRIIDFSELLSSKYNVNLSNFIGKDLDVLLNSLSDQVMFYIDYDVDKEVSNEKDHYHLRERKFFIQGNNYGYMILLYDETQVFKLLRELNQLSNYDTMTGLNNRNYIEDKLKQYNHKKNIGIISLDLNGLKINNDYLGHERGDYLLKKLANNLKSVMADVKVKEIARIGGDEFIVILPSATLKQVEDIKNDILSKCENNDFINSISVSIGLSFDETGLVDIYQLIQQADKDMYEMKNVTSKQYTKEVIAYVQKLEEYIR